MNNLWFNVLKSEHTWALAKSEGELSLPTGTILVLEGFKNAETKREDIKEALKTGFEVAPEEVAFVYFNKGESDAKLRFGVGLATNAITYYFTFSWYFSLRRPNEGPFQAEDVLH